MKRFLVFILIVILSVMSLLCTPLSAYAEEGISYSTVMSDLYKDTSFHPTDFSNTSNEIKIEVLTIAEGKEKELFVYTYQPIYVDNGGNEFTFKASSININIAVDLDDFFVKNYYLSYVHNDGVFYKYQVDGFVVDTSVLSRTYDVISIYRSVNINLPNDNVIDELAYKVGRSFTISSGGEISSKSVDVIPITFQYVGFLRYEDGWILWDNLLFDSHFIAFNTAINISKLEEADVLYSSQHVLYTLTTTLFGNNERYDKGDKLRKIAPLKFGENSVYQAQGWFSVDKHIPQIQTVSSFLDDKQYLQCFAGVVASSQTPNFIDDCVTELNKCSWVLRFDNTFYDSYSIVNEFSSSFYEDYTDISEVTVLRLKGVDEKGEPFNLGVISNKQTGSSNPINDGVKKDYDWTEEFKFIAKLIALVLLVVVLIWLYPVFKFIISVFLFPIKLIKKAFKKNRQRR